MNNTQSGAATRRIVICTTGGTIGASTDSSGAVTAGVSSTAELSVNAPSGIDLHWNQVLNCDSSQMGPADLDAILDAVEEALKDPEVDGVVVAHGTDTLEESAMLIDLHHADPRPVVLTGAQRAADHPEADGPDNLRDAIVIAADPGSRELGALVVFGRAVLQARGLRKWSTTDLIAFARNAPDPATVPVDLPDPLRRPVLPARARLADVRVDVIATAVGGDATAALACADAGAQGLVIEGFGSGNLPPALAQGVKAIIGERPGTAVVVSSRVPRGQSAAVYDGIGGGAGLARSGALFSGHLRSGQAWVLLSCLLSLGAVPGESYFREQWDRYSRVVE